MLRMGGIVLCGGRSSRMGRPKAWLPFGDELMLPRVVRILGAVVSPVVVVAAPDQDVPPLPPEIEIVRDPEEGRGPLQGLAAGLEAVAAMPTQRICHRATCHFCNRRSCAESSTCLVISAFAFRKWATTSIRSPPCIASKLVRSRPVC